MRDTTGRTRMALVAAMLAACAAIALSAAPAMALTGREYASKFGSAGAGARQLDKPEGIAANTETGDVYVADKANNRVDEFTATGEFVLSFGDEVNKTKAEAGATQAERDICTEAEVSEHGVECQAGVSSTGEGPLFDEPKGVAVDNAAGSPDHGDVYVADGKDNVVDVFTAAGVYVTQLTGSGTPAGSFSGPEQVAVDSSGDVYVSDENHGVLDEFELQAGDAYTYIGQITESALSGNFPTALAADDAAGDVYVVASDRLLELGPAPSYPFIATIDTEEPEGVAIEETAGGTVVLADDGNSTAHHLAAHTPDGTLIFGEADLQNNSGGDVYDAFSHEVYVTRYKAKTIAEVVVFKQNDEPLPGVHTGGAFDAGPVKATIAGAIEPEGVETHYRVQYGTSEAYGAPEAVSTTTVEGTGSEPVSLPLEGLQPETAYDYRVVAENANGTIYGDNATFTTGPAVTGVSTGLASSTGATEETLEGSLEPEGEAAEYWFEYTDEAPLGDAATHITTPVSISAPASGPAQVDQVLTGLSPNTTYEYRMIATREIEGTTYTVNGQEQRFVTTTAKPAIGSGQTQASGVSAFGATLEGQLNAENSATTYSFEYALADECAYTEETPCGTSTPAGGPLGGLSAQEVAQAIEGLRPGSEYRFRLVAQDATGTAYGEPATFMTAAVGAADVAPAVTTNAVSGQGYTTATLGGAVNPEGLATSWRIELGATTAYGTTISGQAGLGDAPIAVSEALSDLLPGMTYHYRLVASNSAGTTYGADMTFATPGYAPVAALGLPPTPLLVPTPAFPPVKYTSKFGKGKAKGKLSCKGKAKKRKNALKQCSRMHKGKGKKGGKHKGEGEKGGKHEGKGKGGKHTASNRHKRH